MQKGNIRQFFGDFSGYITRKTYNPFSEPRFILEKGYELGGIADATFFSSKIHTF